MRNSPGPTPPGVPEQEVRRSIKCSKCEDRAEWQGRVYRCKAGHETPG